ncbi:PIN domain-containing protein [Crocosphaera sp. UHCC 0190]|uniref:PIN domain-containing protein n=1 Tax=Crocosphaera sp. UHCC 0190 TaxID=3110246 RepID=UPI002B1F1F67|nr:PIN domain-containing protein [Crocosphaera sp. UHCC 0190]MEA5509337.1 PIN domain-containing protein [Crocosphaera sp. UHCC 0190]
MAERIILLDTGIVGIISNPKASSSEAKNCQQWFKRLLNKGEHFILPEIVDYEIRRELLRANKSQGLKRLDELKQIITYLPLNTEVILLAAQFWANARNQGKPTADNHSLDGDVILAAQARYEALKGYSVVIVTTNTKHLSLFVDARLWQEI